MKRQILLLICLIVNTGLFAQMAYLPPSLTQGSVNDAEITSTILIWDSEGKVRTYIDVSKQPSGTSTIDGTSFYFCWDGVCTDSSESSTDSILIVSSNGVTLNTAGDTAKLVAHYFPNGNAGISTIAFRFGSAAPYGFADVEIQFEATTGGGPTAINEKASASKLSEAYPNPASWMTTISYNSLMDDSYLIIYDITGKEIMSRKLIKGQGMVEVDISTLENGIYFYTIENSEGKIATKKLAVVR